MEYQFSTDYAPITTDGCAFISLGVWAEHFAGKKADAETVNRVYARAVDSKAMDYNCFISDWEEVFNIWLEFLDCDKHAFYIGWWNEDEADLHFENRYSMKDVNATILRVETPWGYHFKTPGFNPWPDLEQGVKLTGERLFKVV